MNTRLEFEMNREEFNLHVEATGAELHSVDEFGIETWSCVYLGHENVLMGRFNPHNNTADLCLI